MSAGIYDFMIEQGAEFAQVLIVQDSAGTLRDFTGYSAEMHVRRRVNSATKLIMFSTSDGSVTLDDVGVITLTKTGAETTAITDDGVYDLFITPADGEPEKLLKGKFVLDRSVTD